LDFLTLEDGTDTLSRNVGKGLPLDAALYPRRAQISIFSHVREILKATINFVMSLCVCLSVRPSTSMEKLGSHAADFHEI
jgi:hypothetical protein